MQRFFYVAFISLSGGVALSQTLTMSSPPIPGSALSVVVTNDQFDAFGIQPLVLLRATGELVTPKAAYQSDAVKMLDSAAQTTLEIDIPATGPGSNGSFLLYFRGGKRAAMRLDVGSADASFPMLHVALENIASGYNSHSWNYDFGTSRIMLLNSGSEAHILGLNDRVRIFAPGSEVALAEMSISGSQIEAGKGIEMSLPLWDLEPGSYTLSVEMEDPLVGPIERRFGMHMPSDHADLHFPGGRFVPDDGVLPAHILANTKPQAGPLTYAFMLGKDEGTTPLGHGLTLPLARDMFVMQSLSSGLFQSLRNGQGRLKAADAPCFCYGLEYYQSPTIQIHHPDLPIFKGLMLRAAAVVIDSHGVAIGVTQAEEVLFE